MNWTDPKQTEKFNLEVKQFGFSFKSKEGKNCFRSVKNSRKPKKSNQNKFMYHFEIQIIDKSSMKFWCFSKYSKWYKYR